jgi:hypothetical protein
MTTMHIEKNGSSVSNSVPRLKASGVQLSLAIFVLFSLAACAGAEKESAPSDQETPTTVPGSVAGSAAPAATARATTYKINDAVEYDGWTVVVLRVQPKWVSE